MIRLERVSGELNSRLVSARARASDVAKVNYKFRILGFIIVTKKSYLGQNCQLFVN